MNLEGCWSVNLGVVNLRPALLIVAFGISPVFVILIAGIAGFVWGKIGREE